MSTDNKNFGKDQQGKNQMNNPQQPNRTGTQQGGFQKPQQDRQQQTGQNKDKGHWGSTTGVGGKKDKEDHR